MEGHYGNIKQHRSDRHPTASSLIVQGWDSPLPSPKPKPKRVDFHFQLCLCGS